MFFHWRAWWHIHCITDQTCYLLLELVASPQYLCSSRHSYHLGSMKLCQVHQAHKTVHHFVLILHWWSGLSAAYQLYQLQGTKMEVEFCPSTIQWAEACHGSMIIRGRIGGKHGQCCLQHAQSIFLLAKCPVLSNIGVPKQKVIAVLQLFQ